MPTLIDRYSFKRRGFTVNELLVSITVASAVSSLVPTIQPLRDRENRIRAEVNQNQIIQGTAIYRHDHYGEYPTDVFDLHDGGYLNFDYSISTDGLIISRGYAFEYVIDADRIEELIEELERLGEEGQRLAELLRRADPKYLVVARPVEPGLTGCTLLYSGDIYPFEIEDPNCEALQIEIERRIQTAALKYVGEQLVGNEDAVSQVYPYVTSPEATQLSFDVLDVDSDDVVSFGDLKKFSGIAPQTVTSTAESTATGDTSPLTALQALLRYVLEEELKVGAGGEQIDEVGVTLAQLPEAPSSVFSSDNFGQLIEELVENQGLANSLTAKVRAAEIVRESWEEAPAEKRDQRARACAEIIKAFRNQLAAKAGDPIDFEDALLLDVLIGVLCPPLDSPQEPTE